MIARTSDPRRQSHLAPLRTAVASTVVLTPCIRRELLHNGIIRLTFDRPQSSANVLDRAVLSELKAHLDWIARQSGLRGVVLDTAKPTIFIAGADLKTLSRANDAEIEDLLEFGQIVFDQLAALTLPTVAAIHGAAMGGGLELVLACDYCIASDNPTTTLALPETQLGLLPAWGGCTRLPRLIGLRRALDFILTGRKISARQAQQIGLVDAVIPHEHLLAQAGRLIAKSKPSRAFHFHWLDRPLAPLAHWRGRKKLLAKTRGHYPAPLLALEVITRGVSLPHRASLANERQALLQLVRTDACRNLVRLFFLREGSKHSAPAQPPVQHAAVIGAGVMGAGIAYALAAHGLRVILRDVDNAKIAAGLQRIRSLAGEAKSRRSISAREVRDILDRICPVTHAVRLSHVDLVIEAATEQLDLKKEIFSQLEPNIGPTTILASNTSALSIAEIAASTRIPDRVVGLHFFNPVQRMELVEVIRGPATSDETVARATALVRAIGKLPVIVQDSPGFLVNRILMPYLEEAVRLFEEGADIAAIDRVMLDFGMPMGPLRLLDEVGLDVALHVAETLAVPFGDRLAVPHALRGMHAVGWLGRKTGRGFFVHRQELAVPNPIAERFRCGNAAAKLSTDELRQRMVLPLLNEAARCAQEGIVANPGDVDLAMVLGTGFAPFRGGPLRYLDALGPQRVMRELIALTEIHPRFAPCARLQELASKGETFYPGKENTHASR